MAGKRSLISSLTHKFNVTMTSLVNIIQNNILRTSLTRRIFKGSAWAGIGKATTTFTGLITSALLTRVLSPEEVGVYTLAMSIVTFAGLIAELGLGRTIIRLLGQAKGEKNSGQIRKIVYTLFWLALVGSILVALLYLLADKVIALQVFHSPALDDISFLIAILVIPTTLSSLLADAFRGLQNFPLSETFEGMLRGILVSLGLAFLWLFKVNASLQEVILIFVASLSINAALAFWMINAKIPVAGDEDYSLPVRGVLGIAWPILFATMVPTITSQGTLWILGSLRATEEVAIYGIVIKFTTLIATPTLLYRQVVAPFIAELYVQERKQAIERMVRMTANLTFIFAGLAGLILIIFGKSILGIIYGEFYSIGAFAMSILIIAQLINVGTGPCTQVLLMTGNQQSYLTVSIISGFISLSLTIWFARLFGFVGAAIGQAVFLALSNLLSAWVAYHKVGIKSWLGLSLAKKIVLEQIFDKVQ